MKTLPARPLGAFQVGARAVSRQSCYFPMLQVMALLVLDGIAGIVTTLWMRVWWAVGGTSGVE